MNEIFTRISWETDYSFRTAPFLFQTIKSDMDTNQLICSYKTEARPFESFRTSSGADPGFLFGGGGAKDYVRERTLRARNPKSLSAGVRGILIQNGL